QAPPARTVCRSLGSAGEADAFEALLASHACARIGHGEETPRGDRPTTLGAYAVLVIRHACQCHLQTPGSLGQSRSAEARELLMLDALGDVEEVAARDAPLRYLGLRLQSSRDGLELRRQQASRPRVVLCPHGVPNPPVISDSDDGCVAPVSCSAKAPRADRPVTRRPWRSSKRRKDSSIVEALLPRL